MFAHRPRCYHPYKPSAPAGIRIPDYINPKRCFNFFKGPNFTTAHSPDPRPLNNPIKDPQYHPQDEPPPTFRIGDFLARHGLGTPQRPPNAKPKGPRNPTPKVKKTNGPTQAPFLAPPRRKHGPKHLSFNHGAVPLHRRAQQLREKRDTLLRKKILDRHERRVARARKGLSRLRWEAEALMEPEHMSEEDKIFLKQLRALQLDQVLNHDLEQCRRRMSRAARDSEARRREHEERDEQAAKMWGEGLDEEALEEQMKKVDAFVRANEEKIEGRYRRAEEQAMRADEERRRAHEAMERKIREAQECLFRQELARKAMEEEERRRKREEQERRMKAEWARKLREEIERREREEKVRRAREERERQQREEKERRQREERVRMLREDVERLRRQAHERFLREERERFVREEQDRQARLLAEQARIAAFEEQIHQVFILYESKWNELRSGNPLPPVDVREMPWPMFGIVSSADQITYDEVKAFLFHPLRPGVEGKSERDKIKAEVLRFHPDKFNTRIVPKIQPSQQAVAREIAGAVARILTRILAEEVEK